MFLIFWKTLKGHRIALGLMGLVLLGLGMLIPNTYEAFGPQHLRAFAGENMPRGIQAFLKADTSLLFSAGAQGYVAISYRHPIFLVIGSAFAIASAAGAIAREVERKTFLLLLARPLPRYRVGLVRAVETAFGLLILVVSILMGTVIGAAIAGLEGIRISGFVLAGINALALFLAVAGYSYLLSALSSDGGRAIGLATGITLALFLMDYLADLWRPLEPMGFFTLFHYYDPVTVAAKGTLMWRDIALLLSVAAAAFGASLFVLQRRDIA